MIHRFAVLSTVSLLVAGCNTITVRETVLSTNQRVAMVSAPGDGITPPTNVVLLEQQRGRYTPVATGFAQAPVTAFVAGAGAGIALGAGNYAAGRATRPSNISVVGSSAQGGAAQGGSAQGGAVNF
jgi:hypothetical protein